MANATPPTLRNATMWLFNNKDGYHISITTNYGTPQEKSGFFSLKGERCRDQWRAFNTDQPGPLMDYFATIKEDWKKITDSPQCAFHFRTSKMAVNTGKDGRRTARAAILVFESNPVWVFKLCLGPLKFDGEFSQDGLSEKQLNANCVGLWTWKEPTQDYEEAF